MVGQIETLFVADPHVLFRHLERVVSDVLRRSGLRNCALGSATSCSKSRAPYLAFASARLMALRRLVAVLPTSSQYHPNLFPTSSLFLSNIHMHTYAT